MMCHIYGYLDTCRVQALPFPTSILPSPLNAKDLVLPKPFCFLGINRSRPAAMIGANAPSSFSVPFSTAAHNATTYKVLDTEAVQLDHQLGQ